MELRWHCDPALLVRGSAEIPAEAVLHFPGGLRDSLADEIGDLSVGQAFDAVWLRPAPRSTLDVVLAHATDPTDALAKIFALGTPADVAGVWVAGRRVRPTQDDTTQDDSPSTHSRPQEAA